MKFLNSFSTYLLATLLIVLLSSFNSLSEAPSFESIQPDTTVYELISMTEQLSTFHEALQSAGLDELLHEEGQVTVFLPVNSAFDNLPAGLLDAYRENEEALQNLITHHIVEGKVRSGDLSDGESVEMMSGETVEISTTGAGLELDQANVIQVDVDAANGIVHVLNNVLLPEE